MEKEYGGRLMEAVETALRLARRGRCRLGMKPLEIGVLLYLEGQRQAGEDQVSPSALSGHMGLHQSAVSGTVAGLEKAGYLRRRHSQKDRRTVELSLTPEGAAQAKLLQERSRRDIEGLVEFLGPEDCGQLVRLLERVCDYYRQEQQPGRPAFRCREEGREEC